MRAIATLLGLLLVGAAGAAPRANMDKVTVYIGTYTSTTSKGVYLADLDLRTGELKLVGLAGECASPSFVALHPNGRFLYAVNEAGNVGGVTAFAIDPHTRMLTLLNRQSSGGGSPCHLVVDREGKSLMVANYGGSLAIMPVAADGTLGPATQVIVNEGSSVVKGRQEGSHAHSVNLPPSGPLMVAADLGLDKMFVYRIDSGAARLIPNDPPSGQLPPGSGPRHVAFSRDGRFAYCINELGNTVTVFGYDAKSGALTQLQNITTLPADFHGQSSCAEVALHPSGRFLYGSNRGHDSIAMYSVDAKAGRLTPLGFEPSGGKNPRSFAIDPTGAYLLAAHQDTDNIVVFRIDQKTGKLTATGHSLTVAKPVCVLPVGGG